jgi:maleylpyruvate isomerase
VSDTIRLYNYWRSSASWRVRIALGLKGLAYEYVTVHLVKDGGQQRSAEHHARNPMEQVPTIELTIDGKRRMVGQSIAILELLDELYPETPIYPRDPYLRARTRELVEIVNSGIQPHQNLTPMARIEAHAKHFNQVGLAAFEERVADIAGKFCVGDTPTAADICLFPQLYSARRFEADVTPFTRLLEIEKACAALDAFSAAHPDRQPDANT